MLITSCFVSIVCQVHRRREVEAESYWDFKALDYNGSGLISLKDAFMLFQEYHAEFFSLDIWHAFLESRDYQGNFL